MLGTVDVGKTMETLLYEYPPTFRVLRHAEYKEPNVLVGHLRVEPGWSCRHPDPNVVGHFTALEAVLSFNQMAYVLTSLMAQAGAYDNVPAISLEAMNDKKFNQMVIRDIRLKFSKPFISTNDYVAEMVLNRHRTLQSPNGIFIATNYECKFMDNKASATTTGAVTLASPEIPRRLGA